MTPVAFLQAQANAAQELEGSKLEKQRKEQLALRQSKQLVPVLPSSKPKQVLGSLNRPRQLHTKPTEKART